jgi:apolipoprotein N-acyltransferase
MSKLARLRKNLLSPISAVLAIISAVLLILAFPDFDFWFLAWVALVPLFFALEREKDSALKSFLTGWTFGVTFFFGTCWWLTFRRARFDSPEKVRRHRDFVRTFFVDFYGIFANGADRQ